MRTLLERDLESVLRQTAGLWEELRGERIFVTGGTGFFGCWLLETFVWATEKLGLNAEAVVLTRNPSQFQRKAPHLASHSAIRLLQGDVRTFADPPGRFYAVIHAATEASAMLNDARPDVMFETIVEGTRHVLEVAGRCGASRLLFTSSGAVYGRQPSDLAHVPEEYKGAPDPTIAASAYAEGKRAAELLCALHAQRQPTQITIARCFAFVGPYQSLDSQFAVTEFIRNGLKREPIRVNGDGTPFRSYLYAADLAVWLWVILFRGSPMRPYNVGSDCALTIAELASAVAGAFTPRPTIDVLRPSASAAAPERYVPCTKRASRELSLRQTVDLVEALRRTIAWHRQANRY